MPCYVCISGDCDNYALLRRGCFAVIDNTGRTWLCFKSNNMPFDVHSIQHILHRMQKKSHELGLSVDGTYFAAIECQRDQLPMLLC